MENLEKIKAAKEYIDQLARGIDPISGRKIPDHDTVNQVSIVRCLYFVSETLEKVIQNGGTEKKKGKRPFTITQEQLQNYRVSASALTISNIVKRMNDLSNDENMKKLNFRQITDYLIEKGFLAEIELPDGKHTRRSTKAGEEIGISTEMRTSMQGRDYLAVTYDSEAQRFILDNMEEILQKRN